VQLAKRGYDVVVSGRNRPAIEETARKIDRALPLVMDVSDRQSIVRAYKTISQRVSSLDVLVNNAGILLDESTSILNVSPKVVHETLDTNTFGPLFVTQTFLPLLKKGSRVVNISSGAGEISKGMSSYAPIYSISKTALNAVTCQLSFALREKGIAVNAVCPGWVRTSMGGWAAPRSVKKGADTAVWLATEAPISETGKF
jgi:NAD(P)-dependent dehydrogenase (short-subunit alcohol dehydrogenase family)